MSSIGCSRSDFCVSSPHDHSADPRRCVADREIFMKGIDYSYYYEQEK
ncbi:MAG: hypothetical protein IKJ81_00275 [Bacteroidales bacterium]|nr:hypothetical protein [Bacteroidales bacterium]